MEEISWLIKSSGSAEAGVTGTSKASMTCIHWHPMTLQEMPLLAWHGFTSTTILINTFLALD